MQRSNGFTLIELITVIIVLGALAAFAVPRLPNVSLFQSQFDGRQVVSSLSRLRAHAIASQCFVVADFTGVELSAALAGDGPCTGELRFIRDAKTDIEALTWNSSSSFSLVFTPLGAARFFSGVVNDLEAPDSEGQQVFSHAATGREIVVEGSTGYARWR